MQIVCVIVHKVLHFANMLQYELNFIDISTLSAGGQSRR